jgi:hypothetical protein
MAASSSYDLDFQFTNNAPIHLQLSFESPVQPVTLKTQNSYEVVDTTDNGSTSYGCVTRVAGQIGTANIAINGLETQVVPLILNETLQNPLSQQNCENGKKAPFPANYFTTALQDFRAELKLPNGNKLLLVSQGVQLSANVLAKESDTYAVTALGHINQKATLLLFLTNENNGVLGEAAQEIH